jgi:hypothetical protein
MFSKKIFILFCLTSLFQNIFSHGYPEPHGIVYFPSSVNSPTPLKHSALTNQHRSECAASFVGEKFPPQIRYKKLSAFSKDDFACLAAHRAMSVDVVYQQYSWYIYLPFREFLRTFPDHEEHIRALLEEKKQKYEMGASKLWGHLSGDYVFGLTKILSHEIWCIERSNLEKEQKQQEQYYAEILQLQKEEYAQEVQDALAEWRELAHVYQEYECGKTAHFHRRCEALKSMQADGASYTHQQYELNQDVQMLLQSYGHDVSSYTTLHGNQLQDTLHQECIELLAETTALPTSSPAYIYQEALVDCIDAAREYNQGGLVYKASMISDFCSAFLAYSSAIVEGTVCGLIGAVQDIIEHPIQTAACVIAGKYVLAYQLCKVMCNVADIGFTALCDSSKAKEKWDDYIEPITKIISAIRTKEITHYDLIKGGAALAVGLIAQHKLLGGLNKLYGGIKVKALEFARNNPSLAPQQFMQTSDGMLLNVTNEAVDHMTDHLVNTGCPASCQQMYEKLKIALKIEEFTSIIKTTKHGIQRLIERGFEVEEVVDLVHRPNYIKFQIDGARVFITKVLNDKYNVMVINERTEEVVTVLRHIPLGRVEKLGNNYGWSLNT